MRRLPLILSAALLCAMAPARAETMDDLAITEAAAALSPGRFLWTDAAAREGAVSVLISLPDQRAYVFRGQKLVAASAVSTGKDGNETPVGAFTILQKREIHNSNLSDDAPMPYMQRLTWDGVALHAGRDPGFPASHGCVRLPAAFARRLFAITDLGATVEVTDVAYVAGAHDDEMAAASGLTGATQREVDQALAAR